MMMKMVRRNPKLLPTLSETMMQTVKMVRRNPIMNSEANMQTQEQQEQILLGLTVAVNTDDDDDDGGRKYRWYSLLPPNCTRVQKFKDGIAVLKSVTPSSNGRRCLTTQVKRTYPSLLHEFSPQDRPLLCNSVALDSKFLLTGSTHIFHLDPLSGQFNAAYKHPMMPPSQDERTPTVVVLDGKIYYFTRSRRSGHAQTICQVFDPITNQWDAFPAPKEIITNQWDAFPAPKDDHPRDELSLIRRIPVAVYANQKKLLVISDMVTARTFDVTTNSWEPGWDFPTQVLWSMDEGYLAGEGHVIAGDLLYMVDPEGGFHAYDLQKQQRIPVCGLDNAAFLPCERTDRRIQPTYLFPLGNQELCLVTSTGSAKAAAGLNVLCLTIHFQKRDDALHAVIRGSDEYFLQDACRMAECVAIKRPGL